ncbi:MAG: RNA polymerase sigma factor [Candidatus Deferrimicrobiaceae bacterium]
MDSAAPPPSNPKDRASEAGTRPVDLLVEAFREGRPGAFDAIVRAHQDRVYAFCARMLSDREDALDIAQEVFLSAYRNLAGFRGESSLSTWLLRIAGNRCLNRIRQRTARAAREVSPGEPRDDEAPFQPPGKEADRPERMVETRETGRILESAIAKLDEDSRLLVLLSDVEGFTYEELAAAAGIPLGTVKSKLHRARMALRKMLAPVV